MTTLGHEVKPVPKPPYRASRIEDMTPAVIEVAASDWNLECAGTLLRKVSDPIRDDGAQDRNEGNQRNTDFEKQMVAGLP